jgi:hypothetical protein
MVDLEGVEVKRTDVVELVLSTYEQLRPIRKTTDKFGLNRGKVRPHHRGGMNQQTNEMSKDIDEQMSDREQMVWLNRAHLSDDDVPDYPRDWSVDD